MKGAASQARSLGRCPTWRLNPLRILRLLLLLALLVGTHAAADSQRSVVFVEPANSTVDIRVSKSFVLSFPLSVPSRDPRERLAFVVERIGTGATASSLQGFVAVPNLNLQGRATLLPLHSALVDFKPGSYRLHILGAWQGRLRLFEEAGPARFVRTRSGKSPYVLNLGRRSGKDAMSASASGSPGDWLGLFLGSRTFVGPSVITLCLLTPHGCDAEHLVVDEDASIGPHSRFAGTHWVLTQPVSARLVTAALGCLPESVELIQVRLSRGAH